MLASGFALIRRTVYSLIMGSGRNETSLPLVVGEEMFHYVLYARLCIYFFFLLLFAQPSSLKLGSGSLKSLFPWKNCFQSSFLPRALV